MDRRTLLATALAGAATMGLARPALAQAIPLDALSRYLNSIRTARTRFTQINPDGTISTGELAIRRPGRVRFDYDPPEPTLVMAGGGQVAIFDGKSNKATPEQYPLAQTPLNLILERNVDLARRGMVTGHRADGAKTVVTAQDPARPQQGSIELVFTSDPVELRQWRIVDGSGQGTTVVLDRLQTGVDLGAGLFSIQNEIRQRGG